MPETFFPLHPAQREVYTDQLLNVDSPVYNIGGYIVLKGRLDKQKLREAVDSAPAVLDFFKLRFNLVEADFVCHFESDFDRIEISDIDFSSHADPYDTAGKWVQQRFNIPFSLNRENLPFEQCLIKISDTEHWLFGKYHHLITDGYGFIVWMQYVAAKYRSLISESDVQFSFSSYREEALKANEYINSPAYEADGNYWKDKIQTRPEKLLQKKYHLSASGQTSSIYRLKLDESKRKLLEEIQLSTKSGLQQITLAALLVYFGKTSSHSEFLFGVPIHKRNSRVLRNIVGMFSGILPFKGTYDPELILSDVLYGIAADQRSDYRHQNYLIGDLSRSLKINTTEGYLTEILVNYEPLDFHLDFTEDIQASVVRLANEDERNPLQFSWRDYGSQQPLELQVHFSLEYFSPEEIELLSSRLLFIIEQFPDKLTTVISEIDILPVAECSLLSSFESRKSVYPSDASLVSLFEDQAEKAPLAIALVFGQQRITYKELNERSNRLAHYLVSKNVQAAQLVPICIARSADLIIGILAILKAGAAYVPIDAGYPADRLRFMVEDTGAGMAILSKATQSKLADTAGFEVIEPDGEDAPAIAAQPATNPGIAIESTQLAYVIYTSGSTGRPKGVLVEHGNVVSLVKGVDYVNPKETDCLLVTGSPSFDATTFEYWSMLLNGGRLILCPEEELLDSSQLKRHITEQRVTIMWFTSGWFNQLVESDPAIFEGLETILAGGEKLSERHIEKFKQQYPHIKLINGYGPTENTTFSVTFEITATDDLRTIPIGLPLNNREAYILNKQQQLVPVGVAGEICLGGAGLSRGYLNRPELTAEKFITNPYGTYPGSRLYRTGDLGRWLPDGNLEYLGRMDEQVKIRGYRIEPGEIESVLLESGILAEAVVIAKEDGRGGKRLVGYLVAKGGGEDRESIREYLSGKLPDYMIPQQWVWLDKLPLTTNGKVDKHALPEPDIQEQLAGGYAAPSTATQQALAQIWQELLGVEQIGIHDDFFERGGDSILTIQLVSRIRRLGYELQPKDVFVQQTIARLAQLLESRTATILSGEQGLLTGPCGLLPIQEWYFEQNQKDVSHFNQTVLLNVNKVVTLTVLQTAIAQLTKQHDALRFTYHKTNNGWNQQYSQTEVEVVAENLKTLSSESLNAAITAHAALHQHTLNIEEGRLIRTVLMETPESEPYNRLLIVIHHLAIDGVSWRILLEDLEHLLIDTLRNEQSQQVLKGTSYRQWYEALNKYSSSCELFSQLTYWENITHHYKPLPPDKNDTDKISLKDEQHYTIQLSKEQTRQLIQDAPQAYQTEINDILLAALTDRLIEWSGNPDVVIGLEGHGREDIANDVDISRTVGWFTSLYPVLLKTSGQTETKELIRSVKDQLRQVPQKGLGYGVLKYIKREASLQGADPWDITFNYLGQLDTALGKRDIFGLADEGTGPAVSDKNTKAAKLSIESFVQNGELVLQWNYSGRHFHPETIQELANGYKNKLEQLVAHCIEKAGSIDPDPLNYGLAPDVSYEELERFINEPLNGRRRKDVSESIYRLSSLQQGMLFHGLYSSESGAYISQFTCDLYRPDAGYFRKSWEAVLQAHTILRSAFYHDVFSIPVQVVYRHAGLEVVELDYSNLTVTAQQEALDAYLKTDSNRGFDFKQPPLTRFALIRLSANRYKMIWSTHHILFDGWSLPVLLTEFLNNYELIAHNKEIEVRPADRYRDYINYLQVSNKAHQESYWRTYLEGVEQSTLLPFIKNQAERTKGIGLYESISIQPDAIAIDQIKAFAKKNQITINTLMQGIWAYLLSVYTRNEHILYAVTVSGRPDDLTDVEQRVGMYINTLPLHAHIQENKSIITWLQQLQSEQVASRQYQHTPLQDIQSWTGIQGDFFDSLLVFLNYPVNRLVSARQWLLQPDNVFMYEQNNFPLTITIGSTGDINIVFTYNSELLKEEYVKEIRNHFEHVLFQIINQNVVFVSDIKLINEAEEQQLLAASNAGKANYKHDRSIIELFNEQVTRVADSTALVFEHEQLTFRELDERSSRLANYLQSKGVKKDVLVPVCVERSMEMIISIVGILKAGGAYVPIDPEYPQDRIDYMLEDTRASLVITSKASRYRLGGKTSAQVIISDGSDQVEINRQSSSIAVSNIEPRQLAYVIYTSGSTGKPKGVMIEHGSLLNYLLNENANYITNNDDKTGSFIHLSYTFDASVTALFMPLLTGKLSVIASNKTANAFEDKNFLKYVPYDFIKLTPVHLSLLQDAIANTGNKNIADKLVLGGEALHLSQFDFYKSKGIDAEVINEYGPTEATVGCSTYSFYIGSNNERLKHGIPIGKPMDGLSLFVLGAKLELLPVGVAGELYIGGTQVARGYLNRPELTAEKFITNPFSKEPGTRLYKTGDLARWLPDGNLEYLGRMDDQVKIRGYRIELGEIESVLQQHENILQAVVLAKEDGSGARRLVGYLVLGADFDKDSVQGYLLERLPEYMVPVFWVELDKLPLTPNGKVDRKALPDPDLSANAGDEHAAPQNETEEKLAEIWQDLLEIDTIGVHSDFFELGGHSLLAIRLISSIRRELRVELSINDIFDYPTIALLAGKIKIESGTELLPAIAITANRPNRIPLSYSQERLWFIDQLEGSLQYHVTAVLRLHGSLNQDALNHALTEIVNRHEILRTVYLEEGGQAYQLVKPADTWQLTVTDGYAFVQDSKALERHIKQITHLPFNLAADDMLRAELIRLTNEEHVLAVTMHHIASDGWSMPILVQEVMELYEAFVQGRNAGLRKLPFQYADYSIWQRSALTDDSITKKTAYWKGKLSDVLPLELPADYPRPAISSTSGAQAGFAIDKDLALQLNKLSQQQGTTLYMTLLAAFKVLLYRYSRQEDICVGTSIAGRPQQELEGLIGFFVNTLALRDTVRGDMPFTELLASVKTTMLEAYANQEVPFEKVVEAVVKERDPARSPLFQVMLVLVNTPEIPELRLGDITFTEEQFEQTTVKFDLTFFINETSEGLKGVVQYSTDLYNAARIGRMMAHFTELLSAVVQMPDQKIGTLRMLSKGEETQLLKAFNNSRISYPKENSIVDLFEEQAERSPRAMAVVFEDERLTYKSLNERANQLAHYLRERGVKKDTLVPLYVERSAETIIGILGILKAGGAYVPIDTDFPADRISYMIEDTRASLLVTSKSSRADLENIAGVELIELDGDKVGAQQTANLPQHVGPEDLAYVIYTSGSTGRPKGVMIEHRNLVDYVFGLNQKLNIDQCRSYALVSTLATDLGNTVIYSSLVFGGTLHVFSKESVSNIDLLHDYFDEHAIDCLKIVPSHWRALSLPEQLLLPKKLLVFGGEALHRELIEDIKASGADCRVVNHYGPTETTIGKLLHLVDSEKEYSGTIPIGRPFSNTNAYVLTADMALCPVGVPGQLYIEGDGVARGYVHNEELTREKFIVNPYNTSGNSLLYSTGDLVQYQEDGNIVFIGRADGQIKIRGYRVELGEIETVLQQSAQVKQGVVIARDDKKGNKQLTGYVVPEDTFDRDSLISFLKESLPDYMVPMQFVELTSMPLTANGKVDRKSLPDPESTGEKGGYVPPSTETEKQLASIWEDILEVDQVGLTDDFFELGGHSLLAVRLISAIRRAFKAELPISEVFDYPTVGQLAGRLNKPENEGIIKGIEAIHARPEFIPLSFSQERLWFIDRMEGSVQYHVPAVLRLRGNLNIKALSGALRDIVSRHEVLRTSILEKDGQAYQSIKEPGKWALTFIDGAHYQNNTAGLEEYIQKVIQEPFDLSKDDMIRGHLITLGKLDSLLVINLHHIASDGWSRSILVRELVTLYKSHDQGLNTSLEPLKLQYADYAIWQRTSLQGELLEQKLDYWKKKLNGVEVLNLPTDYVRPAIQSTNGALLVFNVEPGLTHEIQVFSKSYGTTLYMTLLSAFKVLLYRYSGQEDICVGSGIAGRQQQELEGLIGFFVNTLAMRTQIRGDMSFTDCLHAVKTTTMEAYSHQEVPFEKVVDAVSNERDLSRNPLFQVTFVVQNTPDVPELRLGDVDLSVEDYDHVTTKFDITFSITETENGLQGIAEYNTDLYEKNTIERMASHFVNLLKSVIELPEQKIGLLSMLTGEEKVLLLKGNVSEAAYPKEKSLITLFEEQAARTPDAVALVFEDAELSYSELNQQSNQLARYLQSQGVQSGQLVPLCIERSMGMIVAILGILKAGAAYVPIDPEYPAERILFLLEDTAATLILSSKICKPKLGDTGNLRVIETDGADSAAISNQPLTNLENAVSPGQIAYIIYTSGSTGRPKGVLIEHGSVVNLIFAQSVYFNITKDERVLQFSNYSFDASVEQIFLALFNGATLVLFPEGLQYDTARFEGFLKEQKISHLHATPFFLENIEPGGYENLKRVIAGGDVCRKELAAKWRHHVDFYNEYGPTETTVTAIEYHETGDGEERNIVPIGKPLANVSLYILDQNQELCPAGVPGELFIGGIQVARGYLNRPELTAEKFIADRFSTEAAGRLYRTGDLARWLSDGNMEFLGRIDDQVKLQGYRIELGEIESVLNELEAVENSCVVLKKDASANRLAVYYVPRFEALKKKEHELYNQQVESWKEIHENEYVLAEEEEIEDPEFNILGWNNSFTRQPIAAEEMRQWLQDITSVILSEKPEYVLEIGSGTGLIYYQLAGKIKKYTGTDFSQQSINKISERISSGLRNYGPTELKVSAAHEIALEKEEPLDTIIINSVVQYFPGGDYLNTVIEKSISLLKGAGRIIIGDIRDNRTLTLFKSRLQLARLQDTIAIDEFKWLVEQEVLKEEELCFSPDYFFNLRQAHPQITHVEIQWKQASYINELSQYRFTAIIHVGLEKEIFKPDWQQWDQNTAKDIHAKIKGDADVIAIADAPNPRLTKETQLANALTNKSLRTTDDLKVFAETESSEAKEVAQLINAAESKGYKCRLFLSQDPLKVNILLEKIPSDKFVQTAYTEKTTTREDRYTNIPLFSDISLLFQKEIRSLLQLRLPDYMIPVELTALARLPLNSNGKVDRKFLSRAENRLTAGKLSYQPPRNETEQTLTKIWQELLNIDQAGINDNFFELGGHSLLGMRVISAIRRELNTELSIKDLFVHPTISELAQHLKTQQEKSLLPAIEKSLRPEYVPLSFGQERLWFIDQLEGSVQYHIPVVLNLKGYVDKEALKYALQNVINRHEVLRTVIRQNEGQGYQLLLDAGSWNLTEVNSWNGKDDPEGLLNHIGQLIVSPFDLSKDHMLRAQLIKLKENDHVLLVVLHHIASDGWSTSIIVKELVELYEAYVQQRAALLPNLDVQYADYAIWQRRFLQGEILDAKIAYWKQKLDGVAALQLPTDYLRPSAWVSTGAVKNFFIEKSLSDGLHTLSKKQGSTLFMTLLAAFKVLMYRYSGQQDICIGTSVAGRQQKETEELIGFFINILALRSQLSGSSSFAELLDVVKTNTLEAYENQEVPFERVVEAVAKERDMSRNPICQVMFVLQNTPEVPELRLGDLTLSRNSYEQSTAQYDLIVRITEMPTGLQGSVQYSTALYKEETIGRLMDNFTVLLNSVINNSDQEIDRLRILTNNEEQLLLKEFNATATDYPKDKTILDLFRDQVSARPQSTALVFERERVSYQELDERSNRLAHYLKRRGVKEETLVPVCIERSLEMIVGILGILKAGGAYVPIDPDYPEDRISYMLDDTAARLMLGSKAVRSKLERTTAPEIIELDTEWPEIGLQPAVALAVTVKPNNLCYLIYTSGSTGRPKGVMVEHGGVVNLALSQAGALRLKPGMKTLQFASFGFDASCYEIFNTLLSGGCLVLCTKEDLLSADGLTSLIDKHQVELAVLPPSYQHIIANSLGTIKTIVSAGEPLNEGIGRRIQAQDVRLINAYGPTENTVCVTLTDNPIREDQVIVIGKPIANMQVYILSQAGALSPLGSTGELCVSGAQVARGYLNRTELSAEKFVENPFDKKVHTRLYKTGDLARWLSDGSIEYQGRVDEQVKIRGYRIELGEIESVLQQSGLVRHAIVLAKEDADGHKRLVAYVQPEEDFDKEALQTYLQAKLPEYMVPAQWIPVTDFALTASGKIDKKALPDPDVQLQANSEYAAPGNELEEKLVEIWQELLDLEQVGINDNFFELGGDSILTIQVVSRMRRFGYEFEVTDIFNYQTIATLSQMIASKSARAIAGEQGLLTGEAGLLPIQQWYFEKDPEDVSHYNQSVLLETSKTITTGMLSEAVETLIRQHDALRFIYNRKAEQWEQAYGTEEGKLIVEDLRSVSALSEQITACADKHQRSLDILNGKLVQVVLIQTPETEAYNRLFIVIHHLAIDGVSWRIILEDLEHILNSLHSAAKIDTGAKSSSYRQWYNSLVKYGQSGTVSAQKTYWQQAVKSYKPLPQDNPYTARFRVKDIAHYKVSLDAEQTRKLLQEVPKVYHTEINDLLLAALSKILFIWSGNPKSVIGLEGHGREHIEEGIDTSRTVGWFTTLYPVILQAKKAQKPGDVIKSVKEQLRQIPDKGLGYGVLKYLLKEPSLQGGDPWDMVFNYLGQLDNVAAESKLLKRASENAGAGMSEKQPASAKLSMNNYIIAGELVINWSYSKKHYNTETVVKLANGYIDSLTNLVAHCLEQEPTTAGYTPSDYGLGSDIKYEELDKFLEEDDDDDDNIMSF